VSILGSLVFSMTICELLIVSEPIVSVLKGRAGSSWLPLDRDDQPSGTIKFHWDVGKACRDTGRGGGGLNGRCLTQAQDHGEA
jgi:hypothetical protein